ncbi:cyclin-dependent kinase-like 3 isoform X2 [Gadus macrocephalus]|uniref:cyclin-dependent kinase-like 3 isoform X2 n=1 Tax=Gadus macrocephalus TaxID=80720 RepID=UPI0028CB5C8A|nr:cyclin-dependent kinase-like 3 isoform X2 [Gadus macrocephalus]
MEMYETLGIMGEGSYGRVLKCRQRATGRLVAVKKFIDSDHDPGVRRTAQREIHILRGLRHDNLVMLLDAWRYRRRWYLVFEFVERTVLEDLERNPGGLDPGLAKQYLYQILSALAFCHQNNVIHRDVKPENILVSPGGVAKLCDFGFARRVAAASGGRGGYTDYVATRWYRAPELLVGDSHYGKPVDVWAVGCVYVELVTGHALFPGHSDLDQLYRLIRCFGCSTERQQQMFYRNPAFSGLRFPHCAAREPLDSRDPKIKHAVLQLLQLCLHMDPELRAQSSDLLHNPMFTTRFVEELLSRIQKERGDCSVLPVRNVSRGERTEREEGRRTGLHQDLGKREEVEEGDEKVRVKLKNRLNQKPSRPSLEGEGLLAPPSGPEPRAPRPGEKAGKGLSTPRAGGSRKNLVLSKPIKALVSRVCSLPSIYKTRRTCVTHRKQNSTHNRLLAMPAKDSLEYLATTGRLKPLRSAEFETIQEPDVASSLKFSQTSRDSEVEAMKVDLYLKPSRKAPTETRGQPPSSAAYVLTSVTPCATKTPGGRVVLKHFILGSTCPLETHTSMDPTSSESPKTSRSSSLKTPASPETSSTLKFRVGLETASSLKSPQGLETASSLKAPEGPKTSFSLKAPEGPKTSFSLKAPEGPKTSSSLKAPEGPKTSFSLKAPEGPDSSFFPRLQKGPKYTVPLQEP